MIKEHSVFILIIVAVTLLVYYDSFNNSFMYDDYAFVVENEAIRTLDIRHLISNFTDRNAISSYEGLSKDVWRPLVATSFAIDYKLWQLRPRFYHIENTALHIVNAILVYILAFLIFNNRIAAFLTAMIFAIHPIQTEAVTWISGRANVLFLLFFLLSVIYHIQGKTAASLLLFGASLLSKEMAVTLPLVLMAYDMTLTEKREPKYYIRYYMPFFLICGFYLLARFSVLGVMAQREGWWGGGVFGNLLITVKAVAEYIRLLVFPVSLKVLYPTKVPNGAEVVISLSILSTAAILAFVSRRNKGVLFYVAWFFLTLIPVYNIVPFKASMAERFLYLPMIAFAGIAGLIFSKKGLNYIFMIVLILYGTATISRNVEWRDDMTFFVQELARSPADPMAHYNLGYAAWKEAQKYTKDRARSAQYSMLSVKEYKEAIAMKPGAPRFYFGLACSYYDLGLYDLAIKEYRKVIALEEKADIYNNLAACYYKKGMYDETIKACKRALYLKPGHVNASINMGNAYYMKGDYDRAKAAWSMTKYPKG